MDGVGILFFKGIQRYRGFATVVKGGLRIVAPGLVAFGLPVEDAGAVAVGSFRTRDQVAEETFARITLLHAKALSNQKFILNLATKNEI